MARQGAGRSTVAIAAAVTAVDAWAIVWMILGVTFVDGVASVGIGASPEPLLDILFGSVVTYGALRTFLTGGRIAGAEAMVPPGGGLPWRFVLRDVLLTVPGFLAMLAAGGLLLPLVGAGGMLIGGIVAGVAVQSTAYALFGSMLAEIAAGGPGDPERALARGRGQFVPVVTALLAGPAAGDLVLMLCDRAVILGGIPHGVFSMQAGAVSPLGLLVDMALHGGQAFVDILTAVVLGRAWSDLL